MSGRSDPIAAGYHSSWDAGYNDLAGDFHDAFRTDSTRARLVASNGDAENHVAIVSSNVDNRDVR